MQGSIIGAGRLSFRVRDGTGRFPAAMDRRNFIHPFLGVNLLCFGGGVWLRKLWLRGCGRYASIVSHKNPPYVLVFVLVVVSFRPVSASSLNLLLGVQV